MAYRLYATTDCYKVINTNNQKCVYKTRSLSSAERRIRFLNFKERCLKKLGLT